MKKNVRKVQRLASRRAEPRGSQIARRITNELMSNNLGEKACRLQLRGRNEEDYGGYCRVMVYDTILKHMSADNNLSVPKPAPG